MIRHSPWDTPPFDFAIGLKPIGEDDWLEGGDAEADRKAALLAQGAPVWGETDGSRPGQEEVVTLVEQATGVSLPIRPCRPCGPRPCSAPTIFA